MRISCLSWSPFPPRTLSSRILSSSSLSKDKSAFQKPRTIILLFVLFVCPLYIQNNFWVTCTLLHCPSGIFLKLSLGRDTGVPFKWAVMKKMQSPECPAHELLTNPSRKCCVPAHPWIATLPKEELNRDGELRKMFWLLRGRASCSGALALVSVSSSGCLMIMICSTCTCHHCCSSNYLGFIFFSGVPKPHFYRDLYAFLVENLFCAGWTVQFLVSSCIADVRHKVFRKLVCSIRKKSWCSFITMYTWW